jgi:hypothetical protein
MLLPMAEEIHEIGRQGAATLKRWLEATTHIELPHDAYNTPIDCSVDTFGPMKQLDLAGYMLTEKHTPVFVESKKYTTTGGQYKEFRKFLAIAYSHTAHELEKYGKHRSSRYFWVTFHPFNLENWSVLETYEHMIDALKDGSTYLAGRDINHDLAHEVCSRIAVFVFNPKQEDLSLTREELELIRPALKRKVKTL